MKQLLFGNIGWKLLSLAIAILAWFGLVGEQELTTSTSVPIVFRNLPKELEISSEVPDRIHLEIQGPVGKISHLSGPLVMLDVSDVNRPGERTFTIRQGNTTLPAGVTLARAIPSQLRLRFERRVSREVPIQVRFSSPPPVGYQVVRQELHPSTVKIIGPESHAAQVEFVETDPIDLSQLVSEAEFRVRTYVRDPLVRIDDSSQVSVKVALEKVQ
jgi:YbbR domain-containing protein